MSARDPGLRLCVGDAEFIPSTQLCHATNAATSLPTRLSTNTSTALTLWWQPEQARLPGFTFSLGFGLHFGWAVECAIGSQHKIDASYLSPNVNLAYHPLAPGRLCNVLVGLGWAFRA